MRDTLMDEVFRLLEEATRLEKSGKNRIEAATKYYESCYLMRQVVALAAKSKSSETSDDDENKTYGPSTCHLLEAKIEHYTTVARQLYFKESTVLGEQEFRQPLEQNGQHQQQEQPATSVIIGLLDDAISVITESHVSPPPTLVPVLGNVRGSPMRPRNVPNPTTPVNSSENHKPTINRNDKIRNPTSIWNQEKFGQSRKQQEHQTKRQHQNYEQKQSQPSRLKAIPRHAIAAIERRIHQRANQAHSRLSKAVDLDEQHARLLSSDDESRVRAESIATYVEASELYLSAIQLGEDQKSKLQAAGASKKNRSSPSSITLVQTMAGCQNALLIKLKRLLVSALDRVEALKKEETQQQQHRKQQLFHQYNSNQPDFKAQASTIASSIMATPVATEISRSFQRSPLRQWLSASRQT